MTKYLSFLLFMTGLITFLFSLFAGLNNIKKKLNKSFFFFSFSITIWLISYSIAYYINSEQSRIFFRLGYIGIIFIPITFYSFVRNLLEKKSFNTHEQINYFLGIFFTILIFTDFSFIISLKDYSWGKYPLTNNISHLFFLAFFYYLFSLAIYEMIASMINNKKSSHNETKVGRIRYILFSAIIGSFASVDFLPNYGFDFLPIGFFFMFFYPLMCTYAISKYQLMDLKIVLTRTSIFLIVYTVVLGTPFAIAFGLHDFLNKLVGYYWWVIPLLASTFLATIGPSIYLYIQKKAEDRLLADQRQYQSTLRKASLGMGRVKDLNRLLQLIVHVVTRAVRIDHSSIFLLHEDSEQYILKASKGNRTQYNAFTNTIAIDHSLIKNFKRFKEPLSYEEIRQKLNDQKSALMINLEAIMYKLNAELVVPSYIEDKLIALIVLGKKKSGKIYTQDDMAVFSILANQSALAIENAIFYEDMKRTQAQLFKAEKMATIGTMADGLSHQINNRLHAMGFIAGDAIDTINIHEKEQKPISEETLTDLKFALTRIEQNVKQGGEIVQGLLKYTRKGNEGFENTKLDSIIDAAVSMVKYKIDMKRFMLVLDFDEQLPEIIVNFTQMQEVFFNIIDNSYDAIMQRQAELKEPNFEGELRISAEPIEDGYLQIKIQDNGMGVKPEDLRKIFTPFFTTKLSSKKGTGLGMYVIRQIIETNHHGQVDFHSKHRQGSSTTILLPLAKKE